MSEESLLPLIIGGRTLEAIQLAQRHPVAWMDHQLEYDSLAAHAELASEFLQAWCAALPPFTRLEAAEWAAAQFLNPLVHLDHSYGIAARLVLEAQSAAVAELARSFRDMWVFADGPDAELDPSVVTRLQAYAETLESMDFQPAWSAQSTSD